jgi:glycosyltransferase involved in cell wall biosynthesis
VLEHQRTVPALGTERDYILAFAGPSPHKNIARLIEAFASISGRIPHSLHIVGSLPRGGAVERIVGQLGMGANVQLRGYLSDIAMITELKGATALVFPSLYEGFGLPVVDAQSLGVPVICSTAGSLPEVAGEGALTFDPKSPRDMAAVIARVLGDSSVRERVTRAATRNVARFSWDDTALVTRRVYADALRAKVGRAE